MRLKKHTRINQIIYTELWAKTHMPIFGHTHQIWSILANKLVKYQYSWMIKPALYKRRKGKHKLHSFYEYEFNIYLTVDLYDVFK